MEIVDNMGRSVYHQNLHSFSGGYFQTIINVNTFSRAITNRLCKSGLKYLCRFLIQMVYMVEDRLR